MDVLDDEQCTPLMLVCGVSSSADVSARFEVVRLLVEAGANKHLMNAEGLKAGDLARSSGLHEIYDYLTIQDREAAVSHSFSVL